MAAAYRSYLPIALSALVAAGCSDGGTNTKLSSGDDRVIWENQPLSIVTSQALTLLPLSNLLTLTATIVPPAAPAANATMGANDVFISGTDLYISYNVAGATQVGAVDRLSIATPLYPVRTKTLSFASSDINGVYASGNTLYAIGASPDSATQGAILHRIDLTSAAGTPNASVSLGSYAGTSVTLWKNSIYTLSGDGGGVSILNPTSLATGTASVTTSINDVRGLDWKGTSNLWAVGGGGHVYELAQSGSILRDIVITGANDIPESKSTIQVGNTVAAVSLGRKGAGLICLNDGKLIARVDPPTISGVSPDLTVTNAVAFGDGMLFAANGEAGVYVYSITSSILPNGSTCASLKLTLQGSINLGLSNHYSANNLKYVNSTLYVATGSGGLKVIQVNPSVLTGLITGLLTVL